MKPGKQHQRSKQRCQDLYWEVHVNAQSFVLLSYIMHKLPKKNVSISRVNKVKLFCRVKTQKHKDRHTAENFVAGSTTIPCSLQTVKNRRWAPACNDNFQINNGLRVPHYVRITSAKKELINFLFVNQGDYPLTILSVFFIIWFHFCYS